MKRLDGLGYSNLEIRFSEITIQQDNEYRGVNYLGLAGRYPAGFTLLATVIGSRSGGCGGGLKKSFSVCFLGMFGLGMAEWYYERAHGAGA